MPQHTADIQQTFPARQLRADERELVAEWLAAAGDISSAFVSERRTDDPAIFRRIAISMDGNGVFTHLIHTPAHNDIWIVLNVRHKPEVHQFDSLLEALNFVRPVLRWSNAWPDDGRGEQDRPPPADRPSPGQPIANPNVVYPDVAYPDIERRRGEPPVAILAAGKTTI